MEKGFLKSTLPAHDASVLTDSSLALPADPTRRSPSQVGPNERSVRVQQQVQLTLARKARRTVPNGSVRLQKNRTRSFDATDGLLPDVKVAELGFPTYSFTSGHVRRPSRRTEVSPPMTPESPFCSTFFYRTYAQPGWIRSHKAGALDQSFCSDSFRHHVLSEAPLAMGSQASTMAPFETFRQKSLRQPSHFANASFQRSVKYGSQRSYSQTVKRESLIAQGQSGDMMLGPIQPDEGLAWLPQVRREGQKLFRMMSHPSSVSGVEADAGRLLDVEPAIQHIQAHNVSTLKSENKLPEMTLERAVNLLNQDNEDTLICAAGHIQNQCFRSADAKKIVFFLRGIEKLLQLLSSDSEAVQRVAAGALRNVVYQSSENKMEVKDKDGLATILEALRSSRDVKTRREIAGLLWNLSSHDLLKECLCKEASSVLTKSILVPSSGISEGENPKDELLADAAGFHNATGCLRNLSSAGPDGRKAMRECEDLIDSLVYYIRGAIADYKTDDKSTENCVCVLHNLSYQIADELPETHIRGLQESRQNLAPKAQGIGCFAHRSAKITEQLEEECPLLEEKSNPRGIEWLWSTITIRMYLSLMARSVRHDTQEAAVGALQNITAGNGALTEAITFTIVKRENGLQHVKKMLEERENNVKRTAVSLIRNISCYQELHPNIVKQVLPELVGMLTNDDAGAELPDEVTASLCHILNSLSQSDRQHVRAIVNEGALPKIIDISSRDSSFAPTRAGQAACVLLHTMWKHSDLHGAYKKFGYRKDDFINTWTTKAVN